MQIKILDSYLFIYISIRRQLHNDDYYQKKRRAWIYLILLFFYFLFIFLLMYNIFFLINLYLKFIWNCETSNNNKNKISDDNYLNVIRKKTSIDNFFRRQIFLAAAFSEFLFLSIYLEEILVRFFFFFNFLCDRINIRKSGSIKIFQRFHLNFFLSLSLIHC